MEWFKFYHGAMDSSGKVAQASRMAGCSFVEAFGVWSALLCLASKSPERGSLLIEVGVPYDAADIAEILKLSIETTTRLLEVFTTLQMMRLDGDVWRITNWRKRQESESLRRVRAFRERQRAATVTVTPDVTNGNGESTEYRVQSTDSTHPACGSDDDETPIRAKIREVFSRLMLPQVPTEMDWSELACLIEEKSESDVLRFLKEAEIRRVRRRGVLPYLSTCLRNARQEPSSGNNGGPHAERRINVW